MGNKAFYPGQTWLDTEGKRIQAHGGSVIYVDGIYYCIFTILGSTWV